VVLTTYGTLKEEFGKSKSILYDILWFRVILDEADTIRNKNTVNAKSVFELKGINKWVLTGTPIQNKIEDIWP